MPGIVRVTSISTKWRNQGSNPDVTPQSMFFNCNTIKPFKNRNNLMVTSNRSNNNKQKWQSMGPCGDTETFSEGQDQNYFKILLLILRYCV